MRSGAGPSRTIWQSFATTTPWANTTRSSWITWRSRRHLNIHQLVYNKSFVQIEQLFCSCLEKISTLKRDSNGVSPIEKQLETTLNHSAVSFHLLPLANGAPNKTPDKQPPRKRSRSRSKPRATPKANPKQKGGGKGKTRASVAGGPMYQRQWFTKPKNPKPERRLCWAFNLPGGCNKVAPGSACDRGLHLCAEPGCQKPHSMQQHQWGQGVDTVSLESTSVAGSSKQICDFDQHLSQLFCREVFAGSGRLSATLKSLGLNDSIGVDSHLK